jgi:hypothetical protein
VERVVFVTEPLLSPDFVQFQIVVPLLERLKDRFELAVAAPRISREVAAAIEARGITAIDAGSRFLPLRHPRDEMPPFVWSWIRDTFARSNRRALSRALRDERGLRVNISMTSAVESDCWFVQSRPLGPALDVMGRSVRGGLGLALLAASSAVGLADLHHLRTMARHARQMYSSTHHVAHWFRSQGITVRGVLPVYYLPHFRPTTRNPTRDYVVGYLVKETDTTALRLLCDSGIPVRLFGSKSADWVRGTLQLDKYPNVKVLGYLREEQLRELYSNALATVFPFTEESFGLIPLESMACGTPVLTYRRQGPAETVLDGATGWLVDTPQQMVRWAVRLFQHGYTPSFVSACLRRARDYHIETITTGWVGLLKAISAGEAAPPPVQPPRVPIEAWFPVTPTAGRIRRPRARWPVSNATAYGLPIGHPVAIQATLSGAIALGQDSSAIEAAPVGGPSARPLTQPVSDRSATFVVGVSDRALAGMGGSSTSESVDESGRFGETVDSSASETEVDQGSRP